MIFTVAAAFALSLVAKPPLEIVPAGDAVSADVISVWQAAADGDLVWTSRATRAQAAYDALCMDVLHLSSMCRALGDQARCGIVRGLKPKTVGVSTDGKVAELLVKTPGDELAVFIVREVKVGKAWQVDSVRCPAGFDKTVDARATPAAVTKAVKSMRTSEGRTVTHKETRPAGFAAPPHVGFGWPVFSDFLPPNPGVGDPTWFLPDENCHIADDGSVQKPTPAGAFTQTKRGLAAIVRNNDGERYLAYFEKDATGAPHLVDARCALPIR